MELDLASFELGNEIVNGSGQTNIRNYTIKINEILSTVNRIIKNKTLENISSSPNPFNPKTTFKYFLHEKSMVSITIFDSMGSVVNNLFYGIQYLGLNSASWVSTNNLGHKVPLGIYFY